MNLAKYTYLILSATYMVFLSIFLQAHTNMLASKYTHTYKKLFMHADLNNTELTKTKKEELLFTV